MTGIERLRKLTDATLGYVRVASVTPHDYEYENDVEWDERMHLSELLASIYSQINRELDAMVADSPYEALPPEEREAIAWVRERGGLDAVRAGWSSRVPYDKHERARQRLLDHIAECETALGRRNQRIEELGHRVGDLTRENAELRRRAMPEGCEWLRYESGELVEVGDVVSVTVHNEDGDFERIMAAESVSFDRHGVIICDPCHTVRLLSGERVRRPESKCRDCAHWQKDPTADKMGVCWFFYHEHEGQDCYPARLGDIGACEEFMPRASALAERERGER